MSMGRGGRRAERGGAARAARRRTHAERNAIKIPRYHGRSTSPRRLLGRSRGAAAHCAAGGPGATFAGPQFRRPPPPDARRTPAAALRLRALADCWAAARPADRANAQSSLIELCGTLGVERPRSPGSGYTLPGYALLVARHFATLALMGERYETSDGRYGALAAAA